MKKLTIGSFLLLAAAAQLPAGVIYNFSIDTSSVSGQTGYFDFDLAPGSVPAPLVTAAVNGVSTNATLNPASIILTGDASGSLGSTLTLDNGTSFNDGFQPVTFGSFLSFVLTLSGAGIDTPSSDGSTFAFSLYAADAMTPLLTTAADGSIAGVTADNLNGIQSYANPAGPRQGSVATVTPVVTPEPAAFALVLAGLAAGLWMRRRQIAA